MIGSCDNNRQTIFILNDGKVINSCDVEKPTLIEVDGRQYKILLIRDNGDKIVEISKDIVRAMLTEYRGKLAVTLGDGKIDGNVYIDKNLKVKLGEYKPRITIILESGKIIITGNTYPLKKIIKRQGFKWDNYRRIWVKDNEGDIESIKHALGDEAQILAVIEHDWS